MSYGSVLVVEDDQSLREALIDTLELAGYPVVSASDGHGAIELLSRENVSMVVSDVQMQPMDGYSLLKSIKTNHPEIPVVLMTAYGTIQNAVQAMHDGATDYLVKPFDASKLVSMVDRLVEHQVTDVDKNPVAVDEKTKELLALAKRVAFSDATVLITGDSGCGKEVFARFIHHQSNRASGPFVAINCAAIPENMLEAVLFGYEKGAFTGAYQASAGKFELANGGTLLLDEISEMDLTLQAKLLRVLQEREVERLGGKKTIELDVRVLATSNRNLKKEVVEGRFREDLFYRLNVFPLQLTTLSERKDDILPIAEKLVSKWTGGRSPGLSFSEAAKGRLLAHHWPGNVRELDNVIQRALILCRGETIESEDIFFESLEVGSEPVASSSGCISETPIQTHSSESKNLGEDLRTREHQLIIDVLAEFKGNRKKAAEKLGISARTLRYKLARMREQGVDLPNGSPR